MIHRLTIVRERRIPSGNVNSELQWFGNAFGLFGLRDKDSSCFRVFIMLVKRGRVNKGISSDEIAEQLRLSRGTVVHHLTKLMEAGIVVKEKNGYLLREHDLLSVVKELERDLESFFKELENVAREIDERLG